MNNNVINPPNTPLINGKWLITPEWYRFLVNIQRRVQNTESSADDYRLIEAPAPAADATGFSDAYLAAPPSVPFVDQDLLIPPVQELDPFDVTTTYRAAPQTVSTDADFTIVPALTGKTVRHIGTLTAARMATLGAGARAGTQVTIVRTGAGAFNLSVGGLKNLATSTWATVEYDGSAWFLVSYGAL